MSQERTQASITTGDWLMAGISFFLTPLVPLALGTYSAVKRRKPQSLLYFSVIGLQIAALVLLRIVRWH